MEKALEMDRATTNLRSHSKTPKRLLHELQRPGYPSRKTLLSKAKKRMSKQHHEFGRQIESTATPATQQHAHYNHERNKQANARTNAEP